MTMRTTIIAVTCLLLCRSAVSAQDAAETARLRGAMSASAYASFEATLQSARARGLPVHALVAKGLEGAAKNVPGDRIVIAVKDMNDRMLRAQVILRTDAPASAVDIVAVADALQRGVPEDALRKLSSGAAGRASIALTAYAIADLIAQGVPVAVGVEVIDTWRARGADAARLKEIPATVERLVRQGVAPARAGAGVTAALRAGRPLSGITRVDLPR